MEKVNTQFVNVHDLAKRLGIINPAWLINEAREARIPALRIGRQYFFNANTVKAALAERANKGGGQ